MRPGRGIRSIGIMTCRPNLSLRQVFYSFAALSYAYSMMPEVPVNDGFVFQWPMVLAILAALLYFEVMRRLDNYWANRTPLTDEERLWNHARSRGVSEHAIFQRAAANWSLSADHADTDFNAYLKTGILPHYVRDYLRRLTRRKPARSATPAHNRRRNMVDVLRTPDERFDALPGFPFAPNYVDDLSGFAGLRLHYLDQGPETADATFLCLHGEPTWSYLYRHMIPVFTRAGGRVVAPDFFGFGRSDKPVKPSAYHFDFHRNTLLALIERLDLTRITLVCQDWGGIIGLTLPMAMPGRFSRLVVMNTTLGSGDYQLSKGFLAWRDWARKNPDMRPAKLLKLTCPHLSADECNAYDAPFPDASFKAGIRRFPEMVPDHPDAPGARLSRDARKWLGQSWQGQSFMAIGMKDPVLGPQVMRALKNDIRNCPEPIEVEEAGHFVPEWGEGIAEKAMASFNG
jgi:haloalkane dehalogenase